MANLGCLSFEERYWGSAVLKHGDSEQKAHRSHELVKGAEREDCEERGETELPCESQGRARSQRERPPL